MSCSLVNICERLLLTEGGNKYIPKTNGTRYFTNPNSKIIYICCHQSGIKTNSLIFLSLTNWKKLYPTLLQQTHSRQLLHQSLSLTLKNFCSTIYCKKHCLFVSYIYSFIFKNIMNSVNKTDNKGKYIPYIATTLVHNSSGNLNLFRIYTPLTPSIYTLVVLTWHLLTFAFILNVFLMNCIIPIEKTFLFE